MEQRLQKLLASAGIASRRSCETLISAGKVTVNGQTITEPGAKADPDTDDIRVDGKPLAKRADPIYIVLNKPTGYVTTVSDPHAQHTVMELVKGIEGRVYPVGRLDADSAGLLLLTNDGDFTQQLTHPSHQVPKTYRAVVRGEVPEWAAADMRRGIMLEDGMTAPAKIEWVDYDERNNATIIDVTIHEGRNRQVRRMFDVIGFPVLALTRMRIGPIQLTGLAPGTWRKLHSSEVKALLSSGDTNIPQLPQKPKDSAETVAIERRSADRQDRQEKRERATPPSTPVPPAKRAEKVDSRPNPPRARPDSPPPSRPRPASSDSMRGKPERGGSAGPRPPSRPVRPDRPTRPERPTRPDRPDRASRPFTPPNPSMQDAPSAREKAEKQQAERRESRDEAWREAARVLNQQLAADERAHRHDQEDYAPDTGNKRPAKASKPANASKKDSHVPPNPPQRKPRPGK
jgi:23S rRNA pseudouridine2605 synthase